MDDILTLPAGPLADASLAVVRSSTSEPIADHSIRSFLFARLLAEHEGCLNDAAYDEQLLFAATVMHDLGLGHHAEGQARFEVEGADLAAAVLRNHGVAEADVDKVWEAIALHALRRDRRPPRPADLSHPQRRLLRHRQARRWSSRSTATRGIQRVSPAR